MSTSYSGGDEGGEPRLTPSRERRRSRARRSNARNSFSSVGSHKSFQNVTDSLQVGRIDKEISDTERSIRALQQGIHEAQRRRESRSVIAETEPDDFDEKYFVRHSRPRTFKPIFVLGFSLVCFIMFIVSIGVNGGSVEQFRINPLFGPSVDTLISLGAKDTELLQEGQAHRLIAPMFLHVGVIHLMINLVGLFVIGVPMEQEFGTWRVAVISVSSGISGIVLSALMAPNNVGVGASGVIFGLLGAGWADLFHNWDIYYGKNKGMLVQLLTVTFLNFVFGLMPFVDNFAHLGGFVVGVATGMVLLEKKYGDNESRKGVKIFFRIFSVLVLPIIFGVMLFLLFLGFDVATNCSACSYISCVPFPPDAEDKWWECTPCFNGFGSFTNFTETSVSITCPEGDIIVADPNTVDREEFATEFPFICHEVCE